MYPTAPRSDWNAYLEDLLRELESTSRRRELRTIAGGQGPRVTLENGREVVLCCANDYLGLANDPRLVEAANKVMQQVGFGAGASRLISGTMEEHVALEQEIAQWKGTQAALLFNSGYHANIGIISALTEPGDTVYSDALNHASLIDGCRLSKARIRIYPHGDTDALEAMLTEDSGTGGRRLLVTDTVFSMDGDEAPLERLAELAEAHNAWLMVDEAHAAGIIGPNGRGLVAELGLGDHVHIQMGTLGKAVGAFGAYAAGSRNLIESLLNKARSFVFTTALPPAVAAAARRGIEILRDEEDRRSRVLRLAEQVRTRLSRRGWEVPPGRMPIVPVIIGGDAKTMRIAHGLLEHGVFAVGIRPPTVPAGTSRIRLTLSAAHDTTDLDRIEQAFAAVESLR